MKDILKRATKNIKPFLRYYKKQTIGIIAVFSIVFVILAVMPVYTKAYENNLVESNTYCATLSGKDAHPILYDMFFESGSGAIYKGIEQMLKSDKYKDIDKKLMVKVNDGGSVTIMDNVVVNAGIMNQLNDSLVMVGFFIALVTFGYGLFNSMLRTGGNQGMLLVNQLVHLIIVLCLVINGRNLMLFTVNIGTELTGQIVRDIELDNTVDIDRLCEDIAKQCLTEVKDKGDVLKELNDESDAEIDSETSSSTKSAWWEKFAVSIKKGFSHLLNSTVGYGWYIVGTSTSSLAGCLKYWSQLLVPKFALWVAGIIIQILVYSRSLEILLLCSLAPIAFSFMNENGLANSAGVRYWKNVMALALQGVVIMAIFIITSSISQTFLVQEIYNPAGSHGFANSVIIAFVEVGMVKKSLDLCHQVVGLR